MSRVTYARIVAFLPILLPWLGYLIPDSEPFTRLSWLKGTFGVLLYASWVSGLPYLVCVTIALRYLRGRSVRSYWRLACFAPLIFSAVMVMSLVGLGIVPVKDLAGALVLGVVFIAFGYFYVLIAAAGHLVLHVCGGFNDEPPNPRLQRPALRAAAEPPAR